ncbi:hypothetical protein R6H00_08400, partial [Actinotignum timonense]|uniref:hypothetical protein n=1 Tax=Actinotignum timonense TaxID=1870995 RepID=UPI002A81F841
VIKLAGLVGDLHVVGSLPEAAQRDGRQGGGQVETETARKAVAAAPTIDKQSTLPGNSGRPGYD